MPRYRDVYQRKFDPNPIESYAKFDTQWGVYYIEDFQCVDKEHPNLMRETNLKFLKILHACGIFTIDDQRQTWWKRSICTVDIIGIINAIDSGYRSGWFVDSDLHDDIFEHFSIVSPTILFKHELHESFIQKNQHKFTNLNECKKFLANRAKLFCLYIFLRRCAILYRDTEYKIPLALLLNFLADENNLAKLKSEFLRAKSVVFAGDYWGTGLHEWLTCENTIIALRRTAGLPTPGVTNSESCIKPVQGTLSMKGNSENIFIFSEFNWLDFQFLIRTPTNHIIFHDWNGHPGAVYAEIVPAEKGGTKGKSPKFKWQGNFHALINDKFKEASNISRYMYQVALVYERYVLHDKTPAYISTNAWFLSNGALTNNYYQVSFFKKYKLKESHDDMYIWLRDILNQVDLNQLGHNDKITYVYSDENIIPLTKTIEKANTPLSLTKQ